MNYAAIVKISDKKICPTRGETDEGEPGMRIDINRFVEIAIVAACVHKQEVIFAKCLTTGRLDSTYDNELELLDRAIDDAGFGPEDWQDSVEVDVRGTSFGFITLSHETVMKYETELTRIQ